MGYLVRVSVALTLLLCMSSSASAIDTLALYKAGRCEDFSQAPLACQSTLRGSWGSVWTAPTFGLTQEVWEAQMYGAAISTDTSYVAFLDVISTLPYGRCAEAYAQLICPTFFPPCVPNPNPATNAVISVLPVPVCRSVCLALNEACREHQKGADLLDCYNTTSPLTHQPQWPADSPSCTTAPVLPEGLESIALEYTCPAPMVFEPDIPDQMSGLGCSCTCRQKMYILTSRDAYHSRYVLTSVLSWISFVLVCVLIGTILIFEPLRRYPTRIVLYIAIGLFFVHLGPIGATFIGVDYACKSKTELQFGVSYCGFYAWCLYFGSLVTVIWWCFQSFMIFCYFTLSRHNPEGEKILEKFMLLFGFAYPLVASIILATVPPSTVGTGGGIPFCLGALHRPEYSKVLEWVLWFPVLVLSGLLTAIFIGVSLIKLAVAGYQISMKSPAYFRFLAVMVLFCIYFLATDTSILTFKLMFETQESKDQTSTSVATWYSCMFSWRIPTEQCPHGHFNDSLVLWELVTFSLAGTVLFLCFFVLRKQTWMCWWQLIGNLREGRSAFHGITSGESIRTDRIEKRHSASLGSDSLTPHHSGSSLSS